MSGICRRSWPNMSVISTTGARSARLDNVRLAHRGQMRLIGPLKLERSPQYPFSEASIMFISRRHNSLIQFLRPTTVNEVRGDGIMALFGAPLTHEDHALRA